MHRIDGPGALPGGFFTEGSTSVGTPATVLTADFCNAVQEEMAAVIEGAGVALAKPSNTQLMQALGILIARATPAGAVLPFAMSPAPSGWLPCNGQAVSRSMYAALYAAIGATFGAGDGTTTFNLPDLRAEFIRGWDNSRGVDAGRTLGSTQGDELRSHAHAIQTSGVDASGSGHVADASAPNINTASTQPQGGSETRPRNVAMLYCIKT